MYTEKQTALDLIERALEFAMWCGNNSENKLIQQEALRWIDDRGNFLAKKKRGDYDDIQRHIKAIIAGPGDRTTSKNVENIHKQELDYEDALEFFKNYE